MKDSTLDILILIAGGIAETILMLALEYIDIITERKFLKNLPTGAQVIKFRYSPAQRWFMGIFALIFLLCAAMSASVVKADYWIPMMFLIFGAACAYGLYRFSGRVIIDAQGVTLVRFGINLKLFLGC